MESDEGYGASGKRFFPRVVMVERQGQVFYKNINLACGLNGLTPNMRLLLAGWLLQRERRVPSRTVVHTEYTVYSTSTVLRFSLQ